MAKSIKSLSSMNLRTVKELILDENKLVTYISLSKDLCIHVNEAKKLLRQVVDEIKEKETSVSLNVNCIISGLSNDTLGRTLVCSESDLENEKKKFKTIFFQHIYSVSQGLPHVDNVAFVSLNKFEDFSLCAGLIKGDICVKRSSEEIDTLKSTSQPTADEPKKSVVIRKENKVISKEIVNGNKDDVVRIKEAKSEPLVKTEVISPKKDAKNTLNGKPNIKNGNKPNKGIAGFFTKSNSVPSTKTSKTDKDVKKEIHKDISPETKTHVKQELIKDVTKESMDVDKDDLVEKTEIKKEPENVSKSKIKKNSSLNQIKKNAKVDKKRKRVLHVSDSESEGEKDPFVDEQEPIVESEDEIPPTPSTNTVKITSGILNPKKKRKIVDKTYIDEEGYILTRKEEVLESCSEDETEIQNKEPIEHKPEKENIKQTNKLKSDVSPKEKVKRTKKKVTPPKGKQGNIMNFFKKV